jgi:hypothetical protein
MRHYKLQKEKVQMRNEKRRGRNVKQVLTLALSALLVVSSTGFALAQDLAPAKEPILTGDGSEPVERAAAAATANSENCFLTVPGLNCGLDAGLPNIVAFDYSYFSPGVFPEMSGNHCKLMSDLDAAGYTVRKFKSTAWTDPINHGACVDTVVITSLEYNDCLITPFADATVSLLKQKVEAGLGLLLLNEWGDTTQYTCGAGTAPLADALEATWQAGDFSQAFVAGSNYDSNYPASLFAGVGLWEVSRAAQYDTSDGVVVTSDLGHRAMIAKEYGDGCVVMASDTNWAVDGWIDFSNNRVLANNAFEFLRTCDFGDPNPNQPPVADANNPYLAAAGSELVLDGTGSYDPDGDPLTYAWTFGDGGTGTGATPSYIYTAAGVYDVCLTVSDGSLDDTECVEAVIYDPSAGFVTGAGWIYSPPGAYAYAPDAEGNAHFAFVSRYKKGEKVPSGQTSFKFNTADLKFESTSYEWLVVTGANDAKFKGAGTINGEGDYRFMVWAGDGTPDTFRIKIWYEEAGTEIPVYDNVCESCRAQDTGISGGNIIVHGDKK